MSNFQFPAIIAIRDLRVAHRSMGNVENMEGVNIMMLNWKCWDKYGKTVVVLGHTEQHAIERAYKMYLFRAERAEPME